MMLEHSVAAKLARWSPASRRAGAFGAGVVTILAMAPFFVWPVVYLTLPALMLLMAAGEQEPPSRRRAFVLSRARVSRAASIGWWFGFGYHLAGTFWIGEAFLVEAHIFGWLMPFAVMGMAAGLALFMALAAALAASVSRRDHTFARAIALTVAIGFTEWLRGHIFTGFPWNILGYAFAAPSMILSASIFGIYALTLIVVMSALLPLVMARERQPVLVDAPDAQASRASVKSPTTRWLAALALLPPLAFTLQTTWRSPPREINSDTSSAPRVRIVQPSVLQRDKWNPAHTRRIFDDHLLLSQTNSQGQLDSARGIDVIVWPEAAMPFLPLDSEIAMTELGEMLTGAPEGTTLLAGALRAEPSDGGTTRRVYNSLIGFQAGPRALVSQRYDKIHLVPFGEYLPMQTLLESIGLQQLSRLRGGFAAGQAPRPLLDVARVGAVLPLICYEVIFPGQLVQSAARPRLIVNVTNDGWFGNTTGPRQHLHMAQVRAAEEGLPIIRAANNGISAVIDGYGRVIGKIDLNVRGTRDAHIPPAVDRPLYGRLGDAIFWILLILGSFYLMRNYKFVRRA